MWREMGVRNSYTMEATFCGSLLGGEKGLQFSMRDLEAMGYHFCDTLLDYCDPDQSKVKASSPPLYNSHVTLYPVSSMNATFLLPFLYSFLPLSFPPLYPPPISSHSPPLTSLPQVECILHELEKEYRQSVVAKLAALGREVPPGVDPLDIAMESDLESTDAGSNSSESDGPPVHLIGKVRLSV